MLSNLDYRAALFQAYKAMRFSKGKIYSYEYARAIIKPLPDDRETQQLRIAFNGFTHYKQQCPLADPREAWRMSWRWAREYLNP